LQILSLSASKFRNIPTGNISWLARANLLCGGNGEGKTNLLEAITVLGNLRSFRGATPRVMVCHGQPGYRLGAELQGAGGRRTIEQRVTVGPPLARDLLIDGRSATVSEYLSLCPVFALSAVDDRLVTGPPQQRRAFVDRLAFLLEPQTLAEIRSYQRALRQRNAALSAAGPDDELAAWEGPLAAAAARLVARRMRAVQTIKTRAAEIYRRTGGTGFPELSLKYSCEAWLNGEKPLKILEKSYQNRYNETRARDRKAGHTLEGPHRHDLREEDRGDRFPVVIDDVDAELDNKVLESFGRALDDERQLFLSSARAESALHVATDMGRFDVNGGRCTPHTEAGE
jgi:DNA replication and repair protein RecF